MRNGLAYLSLAIKKSLVTNDLAYLLLMMKKPSEKRFSLFNNGDETKYSDWQSSSFIVDDEKRLMRNSLDYLLLATKKVQWPMI